MLSFRESYANEGHRMPPSVCMSDPQLVCFLKNSTDHATSYLARLRLSGSPLVFPPREGVQRPGTLLGQAMPLVTGNLLDWLLGVIRFSLPVQSSVAKKVGHFDTKPATSAHPFIKAMSERRVPLGVTRTRQVASLVYPPRSSLGKC